MMVKLSSSMVLPMIIRCSTILSVQSSAHWKVGSWTLNPGAKHRRVIERRAVRVCVNG